MLLTVPTHHADLAYPEVNGLSNPDTSLQLYLLLSGGFLHLGLVSCASFSAMPRQGHLLQLFHLFSFLKLHHNSRMVFDPTYPNINIDEFPKRDWEQHYGKCNEEIPEDCPKPLGREFTIRAFVDVNFCSKNSI